MIPTKIPYGGGGLFKIIQFTDSTNTNVAAGGYANRVVEGFSIPTGYKPIAALFVSSGNSDVVLTNFDMSAGRIVCRNVTNTTQVTKYNMKILFAPSHMVEDVV